MIQESVSQYIQNREGMTSEAILNGAKEDISMIAMSLNPHPSNKNLKVEVRIVFSPSDSQC